MKTETFLGLEVYEQHGDELVVRCVFHSPDENPSMWVNTAKSVYLCRSCGAGGTVTDLAERLQASYEPATTEDPADALIRLAGELSTEPEYLNPDSLARYHIVPTDYWGSRGLSPEVVELFELGWDPVDEAGVIPVRDHLGRLIGTVRRMTKGDRKYLYSKGLSIGSVLFGAHLIWSDPVSSFAVCEGPLDAIALWDAQIPAVALGGAGMTRSQRNLLDLLAPSKLVVLTDADKAGRTAAHNIADMVDIEVVVPEYPRGVKDPGEMSPRQRAELARYL